MSDFSPGGMNVKRMTYDGDDEATRYIDIGVAPKIIAYATSSDSFAVFFFSNEGVISHDSLHELENPMVGTSLDVGVTGSIGMNASGVIYVMYIYF